MNDTSSSFTAQLWADVGGTFTDCFVVQDTERRSVKILSSGIVRGQVVFCLGDRLRCTLAVQTPDRFWTGATFRLLHGGRPRYSGKVESHLQTVEPLMIDLKLSKVCDVRSPGEWMIEVDAGLEAPVLAAHVLLRIPLAQSLPPIDVRAGTTRGTNALLTRTGAVVGLVTTKGFGDCLEIGEQNRPHLFDLVIRKPAPLTSHIIEVDERLTAAGGILRPLDSTSIVGPLRRWFHSGIESIAICLLHSHVNDVHERMIEAVAKDVGFKHISVSSQVAPMIKLVSRAETTVLDSYLRPILRDYVDRLQQQFDLRKDDLGTESMSPPATDRSRIRFMSSSGNLVDAAEFRGGDSILSGPAGGVVSLAKIADAYSPQGAIGLDMGGTSTDVCRYAGRIERDYESRKAGVRVLTPMLAIHTVAAGGGSICDVVEGRMVVGPQSAGASPGPACYGRSGPLTVTDLNVVLGRLLPERFPFPLDLEAARIQLSEVNAKLGLNQFARIEDAAAGFLKIAITHMAEAVRTVSTSQGADPRDFVLVGFGGAAGGHLCAIADAICMTKILDHRDASLLSALGMGLADIGRIRTRGVYRFLDSISESEWQALLAAIQSAAVEALGREARGKLGAEVNSGDKRDSSIRISLECDARYQGTETAIPLSAFPFDNLDMRFHDAHLAAFGFVQPCRKIEIATVRCEATIPSRAILDPDNGFRDGANAGTQSIAAIAGVSESSGRSTLAYFNGEFRRVPLLLRSEIPQGQSLDGPAIVVDTNSTLVIESGWTALKLPNQSLEMCRMDRQHTPSKESERATDAVTVEVVARRMQGIADSMGEMLQRTAASINIRQRLDFSCAIFTAAGELIANAPHVPVHLGAMGHTVRAICKKYPKMSVNDVYLSNNPYAGGSHLPDVTVVTPVFCEEISANEQRVPDFYVASRAHHAEIGGKTPGSMPPDAVCLSEEGVVIDTFALQRGDTDAMYQLSEMLAGGLYPSRDPQTNLADIAAQRAAGIMGRNRLVQLVHSMDLHSVNRCVTILFEYAEALVTKWIRSLPARTLSFCDSLDDGTMIAVAVSHDSDRLCIDFEGTSPVHPRCFNATPAIVTAATIYVLRCVIGGPLPMNDGIMRRIDLRLPPGLLNPPQGKTIGESPAVVAGNVETSTRVVDCLLGALGLAAASQGTMNNVLIGDSTFGYYETIGGGAGATPDGVGASGVHTHMTNTRITDPEVYEARYPIRLWRFELRRNSGGIGLHRGGDGLIREIEFLKPLSLVLITNRRGEHRPWGLAGGGSGLPGENQLKRATGELIDLPAATAISALPGDIFTIKTPGGGGWGAG